MKAFLIVLLLMGTAAAEEPAPFDIEEVQGLLALQRLDGWLLYDSGDNDIAREIVRLDGSQTRRWFYFIPQKGEPVAIVAAIEAESFGKLPGKRVEYAGWRDLDAALKAMLKGKKRVAMEYSPQAALPSLSRVDAGTVEKVKSFGVEVVSSADLVQAVKGRWGDEGRVSHAVAVHHLETLKEDAFLYISDQIRARRKVTELDVQQRLWRGLRVRGLVADSPPIVAAGPNTADPHYSPSALRSREIKEGDLVLIEVWGRMDEDPRAIMANATWMAYVGKDVPEKAAKVMKTVVEAREAAIALIKDRAKAAKVVRGHEADKAARTVIEKAGMGKLFIHATGHSLDTKIRGDGANLDDYETHDVRMLMKGTGFTVGPGVYMDGEFGVRSEVSCYLGPDGLEVTTRTQDEIRAILK